MQPWAGLRDPLGRLQPVVLHQPTHPLGVYRGAPLPRDQHFQPPVPIGREPPGQLLECGHDLGVADRASRRGATAASLRYSVLRLTSNTSQALLTLRPVSRHTVSTRAFKEQLPLRAAFFLEPDSPPSGDPRPAQAGRCGSRWPCARRLCHCSPGRPCRPRGAGRAAGSTATGTQRIAPIQLLDRRCRQTLEDALHLSIHGHLQRTASGHGRHSFHPACGRSLAWASPGGSTRSRPPPSGAGGSLPCRPILLSQPRWSTPAWGQYTYRSISLIMMARLAWNEC